MAPQYVAPSARICCRAQTHPALQPHLIIRCHLSHRHLHHLSHRIFIILVIIINNQVAVIIITLDFRFEETLNEKAELEEPSSQWRETSDLAGQPVAISLRMRMVIKMMMKMMIRMIMRIMIRITMRIMMKMVIIVLMIMMITTMIMIDSSMMCIWL